MQQALSASLREGVTSREGQGAALWGPALTPALVDPAGVDPGSHCTGTRAGTSPTTAGGLESAPTSADSGLWAVSPRLFNPFQGTHRGGWSRSPGDPPCGSRVSSWPGGQGCLRLVPRGRWAVSVGRTHQGQCPSAVRGLVTVGSAPAGQQEADTCSWPLWVLAQGSGGEGCGVQGSLLGLGPAAGSQQLAWRGAWVAPGTERWPL